MNIKCSEFFCKLYTYKTIDEYNKENQLKLMPTTENKSICTHSIQSVSALLGNGKSEQSSQVHIHKYMLSEEVLTEYAEKYCLDQA